MERIAWFHEGLPCTPQGFGYAMASAIYSVVEYHGQADCGLHGRSEGKGSLFFYSGLDDPLNRYSVRRRERHRRLYVLDGGEHRQPFPRVKEDDGVLNIA